MNGISSAIAASVEQQGSATREIAAANVQDAARGTSEVAQNIAGVIAASHETRAASERVLASAEALRRQTGAIPGSVDAFLTEVRRS
jgi:methyl-accepting chemotaxis protein